VLVVQRRDNGQWQIPGGILELDESIDAGLRREVLEETGLVVEPARLTGVYQNMVLKVVALVFRAQVVGGQACPTEESQQVAWWAVDRIEKEMGETFAIRVLDALDADQPTIRFHDGIRLISEDQPLSSE
jgi:8-oxo-dGTP pyrophosphatase MutT (NUDIX family)